MRFIHNVLDQLLFEMEKLAVKSDGRCLNWAMTSPAWLTGLCRFHSAALRKLSTRVPGRGGSRRMDFRDPSHSDESDEAILEQPYRPFYSLFGGKPILVKQYGYKPLSLSSITLIWLDTMSTIAKSFENSRFSECSCSTTCRQTREIMLRTSEVGRQRSMDSR